MLHQREKKSYFNRFKKVKITSSSLSPTANKASRELSGLFWLIAADGAFEIEFRLLGVPRPQASGDCLTSALRKTKQNKTKNGVLRPLYTFLHLPSQTQINSVLFSWKIKARFFPHTEVTHPQSSHNCRFLTERFADVTLVTSAHRQVGEKVSLAFRLSSTLVSLGWAAALSCYQL